MSKTDFLKKLARELSDGLPKQAHIMRSDAEKTFRRILMNAFAKFDLVTRDEFDVQTKVLARTRKKITELEDHIATLEKIVKKKSHH